MLIHEFAAETLIILSRNVPHHSLVLNSHHIVP